MKEHRSTPDDNKSRAVANNGSNDQTNTFSSKGTAQLVVSVSSTYKPTGNALNEIKVLDSKIPTAEFQAKKEVLGKGVSKGFKHTNHQANYIKQKDPKSWGYCVEEQLDKIVPSGWGTQVTLSASRPDYGKKAHGKMIFADLTTQGQSGFGGNHITEKLQKSADKGDDDSNWVGADILHSNLNPLSGGGSGSAVVKTNGKVTDKQMQRFQKYSRYCHPANDDFSEEMEDVKWKFGKVSFSTFTQKWGEKERQFFSSYMGKKGF